MFLDRTIHFGETLGDQVRGHSPKHLKSLMEVPNVVHVKVHVLILNKIVISSPQRACSYRASSLLGQDWGDRVRITFRKNEKFWLRFSKYAKWKYMFSASVWSSSHLRSVFLDRVIHFGKTLGDQVKGRSPKTLESIIEVPNVVHLKVHVLSFNMILISSP